MQLILIIGLGGIIGAIFRYYLTRSLENRLLFFFPWVSLCLNFTGCLLLGVLVYFSHTPFIATFPWRFNSIALLLGLLTVFSTFSYESYELLQRAQHLRAASYMFTSLIVSMLCVAAGHYLYLLI